jgi:PASTA domain
MTDIDALCADYLRRLDAALSDLSVGQRRQIVEQITEHLTEARSELTFESEVAVRSILERLGRPEDIAAAAALGNPTGPSPSAAWFVRGRRPLVLGLVVALVAVGLTVGLLASNGSTPSRTSSGNLHPTTTVVGQAIGTVTVPVVLGDNIAQATVDIQSAGLTIQGVEGGPNGLVTSQEPSGGSRVESGSEVTLHTQPASTQPVSPSS